MACDGTDILSHLISMKPLCDIFSGDVWWGWGWEDEGCNIQEEEEEERSCEPTKNHLRVAWRSQWKEAERVTVGRSSE